MGEASVIDRGLRIASKRSVQRLAQRAAAHGVHGLATHVHAFGKKPMTAREPHPLPKAGGRNIVAWLLLASVCLTSVLPQLPSTR